MYDRVKGNARRLVFGLRDISGRRDLVEHLAIILRYYPDQLAIDIKDLLKYIDRLEKIVGDDEYED